MSLHGPQSHGAGPDATGEQGPRRRLFAGVSEFFAEEGAKAGIIAVLSTVAFFGGAALLISQSANWPSVRDQFFNPDDFSASAPDVLREQPGVRWAEESGLTDKQYIVPGGGGFGEIMNNAYC